MRTLVARFASMRTALALMALLLAAVLAGSLGGLMLRPLYQAILALLGGSLLAALVAHPLLRRQPALWVGHLSLLAVLVLAAVGEALSMEGRFELAQGMVFDGRLLDGRRGALRTPVGDDGIDPGLARLALVNEGFEIDYAPGRRRGATRNLLAWQDTLGRRQSAEIGDHRPLRVEGLRITTTPNKGFAPWLRWRPARGDAVDGVVHLPSFPLLELRQSREWALPDGRLAWVLLDTDERLIDPGQATRFELPRRHRLILRLGEARHELEPGQGVEVEGGRIEYLALGRWMGYRVSADPTLPWLLAASLLAALSLALHYVQRFGQAAPAAGRADKGATVARRLETGDA